LLALELVALGPREVAGGLFWRLLWRNQPWLRCLIILVSWRCNRGCLRYIIILSRRRRNHGWLRYILVWLLYFIPLVRWCDFHVAGHVPFRRLQFNGLAGVVGAKRFC
jgi:hypothetical protein